MGTPTAGDAPQASERLLHPSIEAVEEDLGASLDHEWTVERAGRFDGSLDPRDREGTVVDADVGVAGPLLDIEHTRAVASGKCISFVTLGARDVSRLRDFYRRWGWTLRPGASDDFAAFDAGGVRLALFRLELLRDEAAPGDHVPELGSWNGVTLAFNVGSRAAVDAELGVAARAGAAVVAPAIEREWGGYSGYVADPEGNRWEIAWAPDFAT